MGASPTDGVVAVLAAPDIDMLVPPPMLLPSKLTALKPMP